MSPLRKFDKSALSGIMQKDNSDRGNQKHMTDCKIQLNTTIGPMVYNILVWMLVIVCLKCFV